MDFFLVAIVDAQRAQSFTAVDAKVRTWSLRHLASLVIFHEMTLFSRQFGINAQLASKLGIQPLRNV